MTIKSAVSLNAYLSVNPSFNMSLHLSVHPSCLLVSSFVYAFLIPRSIHQLICVSINLSICLHLSDCPSIHVSCPLVCPAIHPSCSFICSPIFPSLNPPVCALVHQFICPNFHRSICLSVHLSIRLFILLYFSPSIQL